MAQDPFKELQNLFSNKYDQKNWKKFLGETFNTSLLSTPDIIKDFDSNIASRVLKLGHIALDQNGIERRIVIYEVTLAQGIILERNRVGLRNLLRKYWRDADAAFIVYHAPESESKKWRFTYVSELAGYDAEGNFQQTQTEPKRYTYVLGEDESIRTAAERFARIAQKANKATLEDIKDAFSVEKLSKDFFDQYKKHYDDFCTYMDRPNIRLTIFKDNKKAIRDFTKKLLGRIVFLYFIQKKGWMGVPVGGKWGEGKVNFLRNLFNQYPQKELFYGHLLTRLFFDTLNTKRQDDLITLEEGNACRIPYLNGGLFEEEDKKHRDIIFAPELFEKLFDFFDQYNFTIYEDDPNDHTVAVDPEMLGHIFENLLEDNKDKGAFYTPKEIVHYMCQESLIEYLTNHLSKEYKDYSQADRDQLTHMVRYKQMTDLLPAQLQRIDALLDVVKICDPSIGSGAFPMGLLQEIYTLKELIAFQLGKPWQPARVKQNIIQNSIYGVDIERGAVDIARLRFWLSLVVDEESPQPLPNLDYKIVVGNSLVSNLGDEIIHIDWHYKARVNKQADTFVKNVQQLSNAITQKQKNYFNPENPSKNKKQLQADIRSLKLELLINQLSYNRMVYESRTSLVSSFAPSAKEILQNTERELTIKGFEQLIEKLKNLKDKPEQPIDFFDWKLAFPEVMNPSGMNSPLIATVNEQILALNKQIDAINVHFQSQHIAIEVLNLQTNIAQGQVDIIKLQLKKIEEFVSELYGEIIKPEKGGIVAEPDTSLSYKVTAINKGVQAINQKADSLNAQMPPENPEAGFDILIGNPPYIQLQKDGGKLAKMYEKQGFETFAKTGDIYSLFYEKGMELLKQGGTLNYITSNKWMRADYGKTTRAFFTKHNPLLLIDMGSGVFDSATVDTNILLIQKAPNRHQLRALDISKEKEVDDINAFAHRFVTLPNLSAEAWTIADETNLRIKAKIEAKGTPLKNWDVQINYGIKTGYNDAFIIDSVKREEILAQCQSPEERQRTEKLIKPILRGRDIKRYKAEWAGLWLIGTFPALKLNIDDYPAVKTYLQSFGKKLHQTGEEFIDEHGEAQKARKKTGNKWFETQDQIGYHQDFEKEKIVWKRIGSIIRFQYDDTGSLCLDSTCFLTGKNIKFLTAYLNSKIAIRQLLENSPKTGTGDVITSVQALEPILIPKISETEQQPFVALVERILAGKERGEDTTALEQQIDLLAYRLYELSYEEVQVIDPDFAWGREAYESVGQRGAGDEPALGMAIAIAHLFSKNP